MFDMSQIVRLPDWTALGTTAFSVVVIPQALASGVNAKAISTFMGHASIAITYDRYGHLMPGSEDEAARLVDDYISRERQRAENAPDMAISQDESA
jgi:hypothetical protein